MPDNDIRAVHLLAAASRQRYSRREIIRRGLAIGLSLSTIGWVLAACGGGEATPTTAATTAPGDATATSGGGGTPAAAATATNTLKTGGTPQDGGEFTVLLASTGATGDLDPQSAYDINTIFFGPYELLIKLKGDSTFEYEPMLAETWGPNDDGTEWTFTLFDNVKFHDGTPCDAQAVVKSFQRLIKMERGPYDVVGRFIEDPDTDITAVDAKTVKFKLKTANPIFEAALASQYGPFVVSPAAVEQHKTADDEWAHEWFVKNMVGTGPYKQVSADLQQVVLERFPDYHGGWDGQHFDRIIFRVVEDTATRRQLIEGGTADALTNSLSPEAVVEMRSNPDLQVAQYGTTQVLWSWMNCGDRLKDPEVRRGFSYAFPYEDVRTGVYKGLIERTGGPLTPTTRGYDTKVFIYDTDLDKAKELIGTQFQPGEKFTFMLDSGSELGLAVAQLFQANLQQIGYDLEIRQVDGATQDSLAYGEAPPSERPDFFGVWSWWPDYNDGYNEIFPNFHSSAAGSAGANLGFYNNPRVDEILDTVADGVPESDYNSLLAEAQNIVTEQDPPVIYWGTGVWYTVLRGDIRGFQWNPIYLGSYDYYQMHRVTG